MRTWARLPGLIAKPCGRCGHLVAVGAPHLVITIPGVGRALRRCVTCAEDLMPPSVAPLPDATTTAYADEHRDALVMGTLATDVNAAGITDLHRGTRRRPSPWAAFDG
jgi:hypothetical protein